MNSNCYLISSSLMMNRLLGHNLSDHNILPQLQFRFISKNSQTNLIQSKERRHKKRLLCKAVASSTKVLIHLPWAPRTKMFLQNLHIWKMELKLKNHLKTSSLQIFIHLKKNKSKKNPTKLSSLVLWFDEALIAFMNSFSFGPFYNLTT